MFLFVNRDLGRSWSSKYNSISNSGDIQIYNHLSSDIKANIPVKCSVNFSHGCFPLSICVNLFESNEKEDEIAGLFIFESLHKAGCFLFRNKSYDRNPEMFMVDTCQSDEYFYGYSMCGLYRVGACILTNQLNKRNQRIKVCYRLTEDGWEKSSRPPFRSYY